jgi:hypothetical protein
MTEHMRFVRGPAQRSDPDPAVAMAEARLVVLSKLVGGGRGGWSIPKVSEVLHWAYFGKGGCLLNHFNINTYKYKHFASEVEKSRQIYALIYINFNFNCLLLL